MPTPGGETCGQCLRHPPRFDATIAALDYLPPVDRLVQALKYAAHLPFAVLFGDLIAAAVPQGMHCPAV